MASDSGNETKIKNGQMAVDKDFQWGKMPQQDLSGQFTRTMVEMRKPKAYEISDPPPWPKNMKLEPKVTAPEIEMRPCPITIHTIKLLRYIKQAQTLIAQFQDKSRSMYGYGPSMANIPQLPKFEEENIAGLRRSRSSSSGNSVDAEDKSLFTAPDPTSSFRFGKSTVSLPHLDVDTSSRILKKSVATVAAHMGYDESTSSALNVLTGVTDAFMTSFSKSLRNTLDSEAETGRTACYDAMDQVLHESGLGGLKDLEEFWKRRIIRRHKMLQIQAEKLAKTLQSMKYPKPGEMQRQIKAEKPQSFTTTYGKWTPVTGMSSSPFPSERTLDTVVGPSWTNQSAKTEPEENFGYSSAATSQQEHFRVKSEYSGFESSTNMFNTEKSEDNFGLGSFYNVEDYRPAKKKTRNT